MTRAMTVRRIENDYRRRRFRARQFELGAQMCLWAFWYFVTGFTGLAAVVVLFMTVSRDETLRFKTTGRYHQTRKSIWLGATPLDQNKRHLLNGWTP